VPCPSAWAAIRCTGAVLANFQHFIAVDGGCAAELVDVGRALFKDGEP
jgi:hypothetical protein